MFYVSRYVELPPHQGHNTSPLSNWEIGLMGCVRWFWPFFFFLFFPPPLLYSLYFTLLCYSLFSSPLVSSLLRVPSLFSSLFLMRPGLCSYALMTISTLAQVLTYEYRDRSMSGKRTQKEVWVQAFYAPPNRQRQQPWKAQNHPWI